AHGAFSMGPATDRTGRATRFDLVRVFGIEPLGTELTLLSQHKLEEGTDIVACLRCRAGMESRSPPDSWRRFMAPPISMAANPIRASNRRKLRREPHPPTQPGYR